MHCFHPRRPVMGRRIPLDFYPVSCDQRRIFGCVFAYFTLSNGVNEVIVHRICIINPERVKSEKKNVIKFETFLHI